MPQSNLPTNTDGALEDEINESLMKLKLSEDPRERLRFFLGKVLRVVITDGRIIVGVFVCTDRDCNIILENSWEYTSEREELNDEPRKIGLALVPGKHIVSVKMKKLME